MKKIAITGLLIRILGMGIGLVSSVLLARLLGPVIFGQYAFLITVTELLSIAALFGTPALILREVAAGIEKEDFKRVRGIIAWSRKETLFISVPVVAVGAGIIYSWQRSHGYNMEVLTWIIPLILVVINALSRQGTNVLQGLNRLIASQALSIIFAPAVFAAILIAAYLVPDLRMGLEITLLLLLGCRLLAFVAIYWTQQYSLPADVRRAAPEIHGQEWLRSALPLLLVGSLLIINTRIDIIMLGYLRDAGDVGLYRVAQRGAQFMLFGVMAVDSIINPLAAKAWANGAKEELQAAVSKSIWLVLLFSLPLLIVFIVAGKPAINLSFGQAYEKAWFPLIILSCGYLSLALLGRGGVILTMSHCERQTALAIGIGVTANIALNLLLIPLYGIKGAAVATALAVSLRMLMETIFAYKKTGINTTIFALLPKWVAFKP